MSRPEPAPLYLDRSEGAAIDIDSLLTSDARSPSDDRPWVVANMVASVDGGTAISERSGGLGGSGDRQQFQALRRLADVILVGASTVRKERYNQPSLGHAGNRRRGSPPRLAIVSRSLDLPDDLPVFTSARSGPPADRPLVLTTAEAAESAGEALRSAAELVACGGQDVDLAAALRRLWAMDARVVLCEGGPILLGQLLDADLVDEWFITIAPIAIGGDSTRITKTLTPHVVRLRLDRVLRSEGFLLLRYLRSP